MSETGPRTARVDPKRQARNCDRGNVMTASQDFRPKRAAKSASAPQGDGASAAQAKTAVEPLSKNVAKPPSKSAPRPRKSATKPAIQGEATSPSAKAAVATVKKPIVKAPKPAPAAIAR